MRATTEVHHFFSTRFSLYRRRLRHAPLNPKTDLDKKTLLYRGYKILYGLEVHNKSH